jgi:hypothetical protein
VSQINPERQFDILRWLVAAQEGQWLVRTAAAYGAVESLKLYGKVRSTQAKSEMKAILTLLGKTKADNLADASQILAEFLRAVYGERGWAGTFKTTAGEASNNGTARVEIEVNRFIALDNAKKVGQGSPEALALMFDTLWSSWFEALLPDADLHVTTQLAGSGGRITDLFIVSAYDPNLAMTMPIATPANKPTSPDMPYAYEPVPSPPAASSPIAELLQIPLEQIVPPKIEPAPVADPYGLSPSTSTSTPPESVRPASRLQQAMQKKQGDAPSAPASPAQPAIDPLTAPHPVEPSTKPNNLSPLFQTDLDKQARDSVDRSKRKNPAIMQKLFLSKQARDMLAESADNPGQEALSIAGGIETILQRLIAQELAVRPGSITVGVHILSLPSGGIQIRVGDRMYEAVSDVPPGRIRELLEQAVAEFNRDDM